MCFATWSLNSKNRDFLEGKRYFSQNPRFCFEVEIDRKQAQSWETNALKSTFVSISIFPRFWSQLGWILASKLEPKKRIGMTFFPSCVQEASKSAPSTSQERPKGTQERPKSSPRVPKSTPRASLERPRGSQEHPGVWEFRNMLRTGRSELQTFDRP